MGTPKKAPKSKRRASTGGQKSTNTRKTSTKSAKGKESQNGPTNVPALKRGESDTFVTLKRKHAMLKALTHSMGIVSPAADMVGIPRQTHYHWMKTDPGYKAEVESIEESRYDFVETKMVERINEGSDTMLIWYSKTKMKHRGFVERTEVEVTNNPSFVIEEKQKGAGKVMDIIHKKGKTGTSD